MTASGSTPPEGGPSTITELAGCRRSRASNLAVPRWWARGQALRLLTLSGVLVLSASVGSLLGVGTAQPASATTPHTGVGVTSRRADLMSSAAAASRHGHGRVLRRVGVSLPLNRLAGFVKKTGSTPDQLSIYQQWAGHPRFDDVAASAARRRGMKILVNWEPWAPKCDCVHQPQWSDRKIAHGAHDAYIRAYARSVKAFTRTGGHVTLRLAHEMNGNWYPWAVGVNGNTAASYVAMWRHVHKVFTSQHVPHVRWMWSPNLAYTGSTPMRATYPGAKYVNDVGLSGYNFGAGKGFHWETFTQLYQPSLTELHKVAPHKSLFIAEIGCASRGGNKAGWISDMFRQIKKRPYIAGVTWFEQRTQRNWMIEDSKADLRAWKAGVALLQRG